MTTVLLSEWTDTLCGVLGHALGRLNLAFGSSRIAGSAYQKRPTKSSPFESRVRRVLRATRAPYPFKV